MILLQPRTLMNITSLWHNELQEVFRAAVEDAKLRSDLSNAKESMEFLRYCVSASLPVETISAMMDGVRKRQFWLIVFITTLVIY